VCVSIPMYLFIIYINAALYFCADMLLCIFVQGLSGSAGCSLKTPVQSTGQRRTPEDDDQGKRRDPSSLSKH